ncbi:imidazole glycerol phosphate synthase subunit HisH [Candidatus Omnitrophota bacterium]
MITIIDYGMGNLRSVQKAFELFYPNVRISSSFKDVLASDKVILPGVGAFSKAMEELEKRDLAGSIIEFIKSGKPFLGICLGLQLLFSESEEGGNIKGLNVLKGRVRRFKESNGIKIPHMGWNKIKINSQKLKAGVLTGIPDESYMYFVHSYYVEPEDRQVVLCKTEHNHVFTSGIHKDNMSAFQFHPEKSQSIGLKIVKNFVDL